MSEAMRGPGPVPSADQLLDANRSYVDAQDRMALLPNYYRWIYGNLAGCLGGTVVDMGCGAGHMIPFYLREAERVIAADHDQPALDQLRARYPDARVTTLFMDLTGAWSELAQARADAVVAMDVLEHMPDPQLVVQRAWQVLKPGGYFLVKVPAQRRLYGNIDVASGHFRRFDPDDLRSLVTPVGFHVVRQRYMNPLGALLYRRKRSARSNFSKSLSTGTLRAINRAIPLLALVDRLLPLPGLSLIGVYRKPAH